MPMNQETLAAFAAEKASNLDAKVKAVLAFEGPDVARIAKLIAKTGQGDFGRTLGRELKAGTSYRTLALGYTVARVIEFSKRPKYATKDAGHCWSQVYRHAQNHLAQATNTLARDARMFGSPDTTQVA